MSALFIIAHKTKKKEHERNNEERVTICCDHVSKYLKYPCKNLTSITTANKFRFTNELLTIPGVN